MNEIETLKNEIYCLSFELEAMADLLIRKEGERWVPGFCDAIVEIEHLARYNWVALFVSDKKVLDIACGCGHGTLLLAKEGKAKAVIGSDISSKAIRYASIRNSYPNVSFVESNAETFKTDESVDVVVSFETIEHLPNADTFLDNVYSLLTDNGHFYVSTPISKLSEDIKPVNPYHLKEWGFLEFQSMVGKYFEIEKVYVQLSIESHPFKLQGLNWAIRRIKKVYESLVYENKTYVKELKRSALMVPIEWNDAVFPVKMIGCSLSGYQILKCKKKVKG